VLLRHGVKAATFKAKDFTTKVKAKNLTSQAKELASKVKDMTSCPPRPRSNTGPTRPRTRQHRAPVLSIYIIFSLYW